MLTHRALVDERADGPVPAHELGDLGRALRALGGVVSQAAAHEQVELLRHVLAHLGQRRQRRALALKREAVAERERPGQGAPHQHAEPVQIAALVEHRAAHLLGRGVGRALHEQARGRVTREDIDAREAGVDEEHAPVLGPDHGPRRELAQDPAGLVDRVQRVGGRGRERGHGVERSRGVVGEPVLDHRALELEARAPRRDVAASLSTCPFDLFGPTGEVGDDADSRELGLTSKVADVAPPQRLVARELGRELTDERGAAVGQPHAPALLAADIVGARDHRVFKGQKREPVRRCRRAARATTVRMGQSSAHVR